MAVGGGPVLLATTFSNNPKTGADFSPQDYPSAASAFQSGAATVNTLGSNFYGDAIYRLSFTFAHSGDTLALNFSSSLFEGKGTDDESWGLDNVTVSATDTSAAPPKITTPPQSLNVSAGSTAVLAVTASDAASYQWTKDGAPIVGATAATFVLSSVKAADPGAYAVVVTNAQGSVTSALTNLTVQSTGVNRLVNLATRASVGAGGDALIAGFVISGTLAKTVLIRGVGRRSTRRSA